MWAEDPDYITVYINGVNCTKYNAWQGFWSGTENCEWGIAEHWLTPISGDIQTVYIEVEEPVAGQPLNFHVQSLGEPEAYMAGAYSYEGKPYDAVWFDTTEGKLNQLIPGAVARSDGGTYRLMVFVHPKEGHQFAKATEKTRTFWVNGQKAKGSCNTDGSQAQVDYTFTFPAAEAGAGVAVSGKITSYNGKKDCTVTLYAAGTTSAVKSVTVNGNNASDQVTQDFTIAGVAPGTYDLVITKPAHLKYTVKNLVVGSSSLDLTAQSGKPYRTISMIVGDLDGDGSINVSDLNVLWDAASFNKNTDAAAKPLSDLNGDGNVNVSDLNILWDASNFNKGLTDCTFNF